MKVSDLMTAAVHVCHPEDTLAQAAQCLWERDCGALPVVDAERRVLGVVTDRDMLMGSHLSGRALREIAVAEAMSPTAHTVRTDDEVEHAAELLAEARLHRLPVVDADGRLAGVLTLADLAGAAERVSAKTRAALAERVLATYAAIHAPRAVAESPVEIQPTAPATPAESERLAAGPKRQAPARKQATDKKKTRSR